MTYLQITKEQLQDILKELEDSGDTTMLFATFGSETHNYTGFKELPGPEYMVELMERIDEKLPGGLECAVCDATKEQLLEMSKELMEQEGWD